MGRAITSEMCLKCGGCCRGFPYVALSADERERLSAHTGLDVSVFAESDRKDEPGHFLKFQKSGSCIFLKEEVGRFICSVYEARPAICRAYPSTLVQDKACGDMWKKSVGSEGV